MVGKTVSHYKIEEKLGEGGMGVVYRARDTRLDRFVALKVLPAEKVADPERKRRFVQEAKSASALNHPNIITIHDIDQADGVDFIAMEFVEGKTLDRLIPRNGMRLGDILRYSIQIAAALARAHAGHRPSRHQASQHYGYSGWPCESAGLRFGQADGASRRLHARFDGADRHRRRHRDRARHHHRNCRLHVT